MEFKVTWTIEIEAETMEEAAQQALAIQRDFFSEATVFEVKNTETGETDTIDGYDYDFADEQPSRNDLISLDHLEGV